MTRRRTVGTTAALGVLMGIACTSVLGIEDRKLRPSLDGPDSGTSGAGGTAGTGDTTGDGGAPGGAAGGPATGGTGLVGPPPPPRQSCEDFFAGAPCSDCTCTTCRAEVDACIATGQCDSGIGCLGDTLCYLDGTGSCATACPAFTGQLSDPSVADRLGQCFDSCFLGCDVGVDYVAACQNTYGPDPCWSNLCQMCDQLTLQDCVDYYDCSSAVSCIADRGCGSGAECLQLGCPDDTNGGVPGYVYDELLGCVDPTACSSPCQPEPCRGAVYACGNCIDDDGDGRRDLDDPACLSACDDSEGGFETALPGDFFDPVNVDCYFDGNAGIADDQCFYTYQCDQLDPFTLGYDPSATVNGQTCPDLISAQSAVCLGTCLAQTPNGCDCFGCCELPPRSGNFVHIGSPACSPEFPEDCPTCTPVPSCQNTCDSCEFCLGDGMALDPTCAQPAPCPGGYPACGLPALAPCPQDTSCVSGCCVP